MVLGYILLSLVLKYPWRSSSNFNNSRGRVVRPELIHSPRPSGGVYLENGASTVPRAPRRAFFFVMNEEFGELTSPSSIISGSVAGLITKQVSQLGIAENHKGESLY